ncbi:MAG TPA: peptidoglycan DD-metalloendopeptidase family protein [Solirubrobacterales bacterium]|nr:peptidoglycan DD-metalloendopeptidase family protein [Solirubrobacterales bacterium]
MPLIRPTAIAFAALLAALCLFAAAAPTAPAEDLSSELESKEAQLEETQHRKGVLTTTISSYARRIERLSGEVASIREQETATRARLAATQQKLATANDELEAAHDHLARLRSHLRVALGALRERLIAIYEQGSPEMIDVLIGEGDLEDIEARTELLDRIHEADEANAARVRSLRDGVALTVERRAAAKGEIEAARNSIAAEQRSLVATRGELQARHGDLVDARGGQEAVLARVRHHETELDGDVESIQAKIAEELAATGSMPLPPGAIKAGSGSMIWPVDGPIASGFGPRTIEGSYEYHPGIDIAVPEGTPIRAALPGTVAFTQSEAESGGYGNYTCIDHGGGLSTCYAHQSAFAVNPGQQVEQGEVIGYSGCTGYCLGPHVHFEVRINGEVTDPLSYL